MKIRFILMCAVGLVLMLCPALAETGDPALDGTWVYSEDYTYDTQADQFSPYQQIYPSAEYEMQINGNNVLIRAHQPFIDPFDLVLNEDTGWFEAVGTLQENQVCIGEKPLSLHIAAYGQDQPTQLTLSGGALDAIGDTLSFNRCDDGLIFDPDFLYGSWRCRGYGDIFDISQIRSYIPGDFELDSFFRYTGNYDLHITKDSITVIESSHYNGDPLFESGRYAAEAMNIQTKEGGLFATVGDSRIKFYIDSAGVLRAVPLMSKGSNDKPAPIEQILATGRWNYTGNEAKLFDRILDIYADAPSMPLGPMYLYSCHNTGLTGESIDEILRDIWNGSITIEEENSITVSIGEEVHTGILAFPDPYTCENKNNFIFYSFDYKGHTISVKYDSVASYEKIQKCNGLLLEISKGNKSSSFFLRTQSYIDRLVGPFHCEFSYSPEGNPADTNATITVNEDLTVVQTLNGEIYTGQFILKDKITAEKLPDNLLIIALNDTVYDVVLNDNGSFSLRSESEMHDYYPMDASIAALITDETSIRFNAGSSVSADGLVDESEMIALIDRFDMSTLTFSEDWSRGVLKTMIWNEYGDKVNYTELEILGSETRGVQRTVRLKLDGEEMTFVFVNHPSNGITAELLMGIFHVPYELYN